MTYKLLIKTHNQTGLNYLCYTQKNDYEKYQGSGKRWKRHIKKHGYDVSTVLIFETENYEELKRKGLELSDQFNIVQSKKWANLIPEGGDGGKTNINRKWITNGKEDRIKNRLGRLPKGFWFGRSNCLFNDSETQKTFNSKKKLKEPKTKLPKNPDSYKLAAQARARRIYICEQCKRKCLANHYYKNHGSKCQWKFYTSKKSMKPICT